MPMNLTVLVDNHTLIDRYFLGEPGLSFFIEIEGTRILFDAGYSSIFIDNARRMGIDLLDLDVVVLSHAHLDHTWGLRHLIDLFAQAAFEGRPVKRPQLVAHPAVFVSRVFGAVQEIGSLVSEDRAASHFDLRLTARPVWLHPRLVFLGEIERVTDFEGQTPIGRIRQPDGLRPDLLLDDSALAYRSTEGLVLVTGCAHAGICNTTAHAMKVCGDQHIRDIIGGFHLLDTPRDQLTETIRYLKKCAPDEIHACHCTDLSAKIALSRAAPVKAVGVGLKLTYPD